MVLKKDNNIFFQRSRLMTAFLLILAGVISTRLFYLQVVKGSSIKLNAQNQHSIYRKLFPSRGEIKITDKDQKETYIVAGTAKKYLAYAVPQEITNPVQTASDLAEILLLEKSEIYEKITNKQKKYVPIKKALTEKEQEDIKAKNLPGIFFDSEDARIYPEKNLLSQVLGFVGFKDEGKAGLYGLERYFEKELAGKAGELRQEKDSSGAWIFGSRRDLVQPEDGVNLVLTIDKNIQFQAEKILKDAVTKHEADSGSIVVADPKTGKILAMAGYPDFNPNEYNKVEDPKNFQNLATLGSYEPGSVFKPLTMAAAINEGKIKADTVYTDTGLVEIDGYKIKNSDNKSHGEQTMTQALEKSLNTGVIFAKDQIGNKTFFEYIKKFGFGQATGIELSEVKGNLDNLKADIKVNFHTASFGQGISVTPIQLVQAFTSVANGGKMVQPYLVQTQIFPSGKVENTKTKVVAEVISESTANVVSAMMVNVVENGHGKRAAVPGYFIAGKTGTAQVPKKDGRGYEENNNIGSFIGFGPVENPRFLMLVRIDHPRTVDFAETTAAPAFGELAKFILNYYQVPPSR